jgi:hypothetical protein
MFLPSVVGRAVVAVVGALEELRFQQQFIFHPPQP